MRVVPVPCLSDNYAYLVICERTRLAAIVDPGEAAPVREAAEREGVKLAAVWATHHHPDHVGGVEALGVAEVVAHERDRDRIKGASHIVGDGSEVSVGDLRAKIVHNPGHTQGAISYHVDGALFTGDTLFGGGCGRLFEGTAQDMTLSLMRLVAHPLETKVYFGHEYTASNLRFAAAVEPNNTEITERAAAIAGVTTPSTVELELHTNPFARVRYQPVMDAAKARDPSIDASNPSAVLAVIRAWKDGFR